MLRLTGMLSALIIPSHLGKNSCRQEKHENHAKTPMACMQSNPMVHPEGFLDGPLLVVFPTSLIPITPCDKPHYGLGRKWFSFAWKEYMWTWTNQSCGRHIFWWRNDESSLFFLTDLSGAEPHRPRAQETNGKAELELWGMAVWGWGTPRCPRHRSGLQWPPSSWQTAQSFPQSQQAPGTSWLWH